MPSSLGSTGDTTASQPASSKPCSL